MKGINFPLNIQHRKIKRPDGVAADVTIKEATTFFRWGKSICFGSTSPITKCIWIDSLTSNWIYAYRVYSIGLMNVGVSRGVLAQFEMSRGLEYGVKCLVSPFTIVKPQIQG